MIDVVKSGSTNYILPVFIQDTSSLPNGLTGLTSASSGISCFYKRDGADAAVEVSLSAGTVGTFSSGGFVEVDSTNMPGVYELSIPDAALLTGSDWVTIIIHGATNQADTAVQIRLADNLSTDVYSLVSNYANLASNLGFTEVRDDLRWIRQAIEGLARA